MRLNHRRGGSGEPLVLVHGIGSRWQVWEPVLDRLEARRDVIALDLPGFGDSPRPAHGTAPGIGSLTQLVAEFFDEQGLERPHVAGNSLGGWIALELAKQDRARTATGLSPAGFQSRAESLFSQGSLWLSARSARTLARRPARLASPTVRRIAFGQLAAHPERLSYADAVATVRALAAAPWLDETLPAIGAEQFGGGAQIRVPVTIAWGEHDRLLLPHQARRAARLIPSARSITLRGCGHVPTYDDPEQVAAVILEASSQG